jgi:hypothetical protein
MPCETCTSKVHSQRSANKHMSAVDHWAPRYPCEACEKVYRSPQAAREHMDRRNHWRTYYCSDCDRGFQNQNNLNMVGVQAEAAQRSQGQDLNSEYISANPVSSISTPACTEAPKLPARSVRAPSQPQAASHTTSNPPPALVPKMSIAKLFTEQSSLAIGKVSSQKTY